MRCPITSPRRVARRALMAALTLGVLGSSPSGAAAGTYHVYACQMPNGAAIPASDWVFERSGAEVALPLGQDLCADEGYAALEFGAEPTTAGDWTGWGLTLPVGLKATFLTFYRWNQMRAATIASDDRAHPAAEFIYGQSKRWYDPATTIPEWCYYGEGCNGYGWPNVSTTGGPKVVADFPGGASFVGFALRCRTDTGQTGGSCGGRPGGRALERILGLDLIVRDDAAPQLGSLTGTLTEASPRSGTVGLRYAATDVGAGLRSAVLELDGVEASRYQPDDSASCADAGAVADDPYEYLRLQPCSRAVNVGFDVDTTRLGNGTHRATTYVVDASGNRSASASRDFVVLNGPVATPTPVAVPVATATPGASATPVAPAVPPATPAATAAPPAAAANGSGGDPLSATLRGTGKRTVRAKFGTTKVLLGGRLLDAGGTPVVGASVDVLERLAVRGAAWVKTASVPTAADGAYRYRPKATASREVRFSYVATVGAPARSTQDVTLSVAAGMTITAKPKVVRPRGLITLTGRVKIDALPATGTWVEVQVLQGRAWRTVGTRRVGRDGSWTFRHRLKTARNAKLSFRTRLRPTSDLPSTEAVSAPTPVLIR